MNRNLGFKVRIMLLMVASGISNAYCVMNFKTPVLTTLAMPQPSHFP